MDKPIGNLTIKDVAEHAGVSTATVSHVINATRYVSPELTQRVKQSIEELHYIPNQIIGSLRSNKTYTVGLVIPSYSNETFAYLAEKIQKIIFTHGYSLLICSTSYDEEIENNAFNMLIMKNVDAVIMAPTTTSAVKINEFIKRGIKVILIDRTIEGINLDTIRIDNYLGSYLATEHLIRLGHTQIGYIDRKIDQSHSVEQRSGYLQALKDYGLQFHGKNLIRADGYDYDAGETTVKKLLNRNAFITAIHAYYDIMALGVMRGIQAMGLNVPKNISVVGYDDMPWTTAVNPRLTTISIPIKKMAERACEQVLRRLDNQCSDDESPIEVLLKPRIVIRESTRSFSDVERKFS